MSDWKQRLEKLKQHCISDEESQRLEREREREAAMRIEQARIEKANAIIPPKYQRYDETKLPGIEIAKARKVTDWNFPEGKGLYIVGETGLGKSMMFYELIRRRFGI